MERGEEGKMTIGERVKKKREEIGISGSELARRVDVNRSYICQLERGTKSMPHETLKVIAKTLGCTVFDLDPDLIKQWQDYQQKERGSICDQ